MSGNVSGIELDEVSALGNEEGSLLIKRDLNLINHVAVEITAEIGTAELTVQELFSLKAGDVVKLLQQVNEPVTLRLEGKAVARGHLVAVDDNFGVQLTEIS